MNYRIISKESLLKLNNKEAYVFCCIILNTDLCNNGNIYISHIKEETLAEMAKCSKKTIVTYIDKFKQLQLLNVETQKIKGEKGVFNRNTYLIKIPDTNWFRLEYDFLKEEIPCALKGYLLLLKCLGFKGSNTILYSLDVIGRQKLFRIGLNKIKELTRLGLYHKVIANSKNGYTITDNYFHEDTPKMETASLSEQYLINYYNKIVSYCKKLEIKPPKYDKELMKTIFDNCPNIEFFLDKMNNRNFPKTQINSLMYFVKTFNFNIPEPKVKIEDDYIIMP